MITLPFLRTKYNDYASFPAHAVQTITLGSVIRSDGSASPCCAGVIPAICGLESKCRLRRRFLSCACSITIALGSRSDRNYGGQGNADPPGDENKKVYLDLLLLADEQEDMIDRYLERGTMYILEDDGVKAECVVTDEGDGSWRSKIWPWFRPARDGDTDAG